MASWHRESCRRPDVHPAGDADACYCSSCDTFLPLDQLAPDETGFVHAVPEQRAGKELRLTWPKSVRFSNAQDAHTSQCDTKVDKIPQQINSSAPTSRRVYKSLETTNQIRLLMLSKGNFDEPIHGTLMIARLDSNIQFRALSYTWADDTGNDSYSKVIFLGPRWDMFMVTANCKAALRRLRRKDHDCMVWVDAICIDQGNDLERNHQVGLMRKIYSAASEVFVYLGETSSLSNEAFERLMWAKKHQKIDDKGRQSLEGLFKMRYFYRIWVIQEIANAKLATINYGDKSIGWSILDEERLKTLDIHDKAPKWISSIYLHQEYTINDFANLLFSTNSSGASDPRDKVFALLGLVKDADQFGLIADYSLTLQEVQVGVAAFFIIHGDDCSILAYAAGVNNAIYRTPVPSWVPVWDRQYKSNPIPRGTKRFDGYEILRGVHVASCVSNPISGDTLSKPRIHHINGSLSILALELINFSHLTDCWDKYLYKNVLSNVSDFYPGLRFLLNKRVEQRQDGIVLFKGCETLFHIRKRPKSSTYQIVGVCNILLSLEHQNLDQSVNMSELDIVSHFMVQRCSLERQHLQEMIKLETLLKVLKLWDSENHQSPDIQLCESMFSDSVITQVLAASIKGISLEFSQSELESSILQGNGSQPCLPDPPSLPEKKVSDSADTIFSGGEPSQAQWLTTRLLFWDSHSSWEVVSTLGSIYSGWLDWRDLKAELESAVFVSIFGGLDLNYLKKKTERNVKELADLTISLTGRLVRATGPFYIKQCRLRIGERDLSLLERPNSSGLILGATSDDIGSAISRAFEWSHKNSRKKYLPGFSKVDNVFVFTHWDWSELETLLEPLEAFHSSRIGDLQYSCSARIFLRMLVPRVREWEWMTVV